MPLVRVEMMKGKTSEYKKKVLDCIHAGLMTSKLADQLNISPTDVFIVINEPPYENWGMAGVQKRQE